jgi:hypothetical protein
MEEETPRYFKVEEQKLSSMEKSKKSPDQTERGQNIAKHTLRW